MAYTRNDISAELRQNAILTKRLETLPFKGKPACCSSSERALHIIYENNGIAQKSLADLMGIRGQTLGAMIRKFEEEGLLEKRNPPYDTRIISLYLTEKGKKKFSDSAEVPEKCLPQMGSSLTDEEVDELVTLLKKLNVSLEDSIRKAQNKKRRVMPSLYR